ncbi:MAG: cache domain-containing protein [Candidatus Saganbacteria bacterium]|nr:cache domain-containing protein [Candidatus Saganbacteria bacterium]
MKKTFALFALLLLCLAPARVLAMGTPPHLPGLIELRSRISAELNALDSDLAAAAQQLGTVGFYGNSAEILQKVYDAHPSVVDVATINPEGYLMTVRPARYKKAEGQRVNEQSHFRAIQKSGRPVMSEMFKTVEGFYAAALIYPVINLKGQTIGYVSAVFKPDALMGKIIKPYLAQLPRVDAFALQRDGRIIYDHDILQVGKMTFSDPAYQSYSELLALAARITAEASGAGTYTFPVGLTNAPAKKATEWVTVSLHGTDWRLVVAKAE